MKPTVKKIGRPPLSLTDLPNPLRKIRNERGLSLKQFADMLGIKPPSLYQHETRGGVLSEDTILRAAELLGVDPCQLDDRLRKKAERLGVLVAKN